MTGCASNSADKINIQQKASLISRGMSKQEVVSIMGYPLASEVKRSVDEWHYCEKEVLFRSIPAYLVAVYFAEEQVIGVKPYTLEDHRNSCATAVKRGNYREPDVVREYRFR